MRLQNLVNDDWKLYIYINMYLHLYVITYINNCVIMFKCIYVIIANEYINIGYKEGQNEYQCYTI